MRMQREKNGNTHAVAPRTVLTSTSWGSGSSSRPPEMEQEERERERWGFSVRSTLGPCGPKAPQASSC